jgi:hypothetical protein
MRFRWIAISLSITACSRPSLQSPEPSERIEAIASLEHRRDAVPGLLPSLASSDPLVRQQAQRALVDRTGTTRGYDWSDPPEQRAKAIARWHAWCIEQGLVSQEGTP